LHEDGIEVFEEVGFDLGGGFPVEGGESGEDYGEGVDA